MFLMINDLANRLEELKQIPGAFNTPKPFNQMVMTVDFLFKEIKTEYESIYNYSSEMKKNETPVMDGDEPMPRKSRELVRLYDLWKEYTPDERYIDEEDRSDISDRLYKPVSYSNSVFIIKNITKFLLPEHTPKNNRVKESLCSVSTNKLYENTTACVIEDANQFNSAKSRLAYYVKNNKHIINNAMHLIDICFNKMLEDNPTISKEDFEEEPYATNICERIKEYLEEIGEEEPYNNAFYNCIDVMPDNWPYWRKMDELSKIAAMYFYENL